jgi:hypothetical protein
MSPASYLTAPPRVAATIVAPVMSFWIALAVLLVGVVAGIAYAVVRGIAMWRQIKRTGATLNVETARIADASAQIQEHLDRASASSALLGDAAERLAVSRAKLDVQLQALREARRTVRRVLWFLPGV